MKKILTILLLSTALPAVAIAQSVSGSTDTTLQGDVTLKPPSAAETNPAVTMEQQIKTDAEPVLNTAPPTAESLVPAAAAPAVNATITPAPAAPDMSATTNITADSKTETEVKAEQPDAAPTEPTPVIEPAVTTEAPAAATTTPATTTEAAAPAAAAETTAKAATTVKRPNLNRTKIRKVQQALKDNGSYTGSVDGKWGAKSAAAVSDFQSKNGLAVTGELDAQTIEKLGVNLNASSKKSGSAHQADMTDPANRALESRVVPKDSILPNGAAVTTDTGVTATTPVAPASAPTAPVQVPAPASDAAAPPAPATPAAPHALTPPAPAPAAAPTAPESAPAPMPAPAQTDTMAPAGNAPEGNTGYSTTY